jgi:hypothetical protein
MDFSQCIIGNPAMAEMGQFLPPRFATAMEELAQKPDTKAPTALPLYD